MPKSRQTIPPKQSSTSMPPPHSYTVTQFRSTQNDDDDDICPVCESECTCKSSNNSQSTPSVHLPLPSPSSSPASTLVPLKIKLPPRNLLNTLAKPLGGKRAQIKSSKPKQTTVGSEIVNGNKTNSKYIILHRPGPFSALGHQLGAPSPVASTSRITPLRDTSPLTPEPEPQPPSTIQGKPKPPAKATFSKSRKKTATNPRLRPSATQKKPTRSRKVKDVAWTTSSTKRKGKRPVQTSSDESLGNLTDEDTYVTRMVIDSDGTESVQFPTFISAISTTSDNDDSASTMTDSFDSDSSIRAEEEDLILAEQRAKVRREILNGEESWHMEKRKWDHLKNNNNWEIRPRKRSVGPEDCDDGSNSESESGMEVDEEEEEGDGDDDDDPDIRYGRGMVTGWQSDDDDFDAELFFATLTDSSGPGSDADAEDGDDSGDEQSDNSDLSSISMTEAAAAGLLQSPLGAGCPLVVTEDWDGRLVFANGLKDGQGVLDVHFEVDAAQRYRNIGEAMEVDPGETDETVNDIDEDEDDLLSDNDGDTTDDMLDHRPGISTPQGVVPIPFRFPTPPVTYIDPLSTFSPIVGTRNKLTRGPLVESPKPADILAAVGKTLRDGGSALNSPTVSVAAASPPGTSGSSSQSRQMPSMGSFDQVSKDPKHSAIIDGTKAVFSPFTRVKRVRRPTGRGRKKATTSTDMFPYMLKRSRRSSLPGSSTAADPVDAEDEGDPIVQSSPELYLPATSIDLDDVLDAAFLDSDGAAEHMTNTSGERHLRNLSRWDRVPMGTFRRSRAAHMDENNVHVPSLAPSNDGVSYGSAGGLVLRKTPIGVALWQTNNRKEKSRHPPGSVAVSPVIFPVRDGERTPTGGEFTEDLLQKMIAVEPGPSKSHKQKRKEKKKRNCAASSNSFHNLPPTVPPLNL